MYFNKNPSRQCLEGFFVSPYLCNVNKTIQLQDLGNRDYKETWVKQVFTHCFSNFGQKRVMLASNFPLTLLSKSYQDYWQQIISICKIEIAKNSLIDNDDINDVLTDICANNAKHLYKLGQIDSPAK